ncbi:hypothetical protein QFW77_11215 [Luteimonas sp. RD2P54]|uniref:Uncharacterized protein n=1 Tax=Luteimonas endophytica TaxID=3042023 RepID=A0ABT6J9P8_9GAMM|nr:hypothetical protein [Luteimonas endophytica]MDH5823555.1 hypothetical protein [Luteimonas endophytica]
MKIETSRKLQQEELDLAAANGRYSVLCALAAAVAFGFGSVWIPGMLLVVAGHFLLSYIHHRSTAKRYSLPAESELPTSEDDPAPIFQTTIEVGEAWRL